MGKFSTHKTGLTKTTLLSVLIFFSFFFSTNMWGQNYKVPTINTADDYGSKVYIDPSDNTGPYEGTLSNPYNAWDQISFSSNTAYLLKAGTTLDAISDITVSNIYVGKYGNGAKPIVGARFDIQADNVTIDSVDFFYKRTAYAPMIGYSANYLTIANCQITGIIDSDGNYPHRGIQGGGSNFTLFHCEVSYTTDDGYYGGTLQNCKFVSNYFHHNNMANDPKYTGGTGDGIQFESAYANNAYLANNFIDRENSYWKFALIFNSSLAKTSNAVCEWNTFVSPKVGNGGLAVRWLGGTNNTFTKNLINTNDGITGIGSASNLHLNQDYPYGVRDNHEFGPGSDCSGCTSTDNLDFETEEDYETYLAENSIERYGSDLDTANYWGKSSTVYPKPPSDPCEDKPIAINSDITPDTNSTSVGTIDLSVSGGYSGKEYSWSNGESTSSLSGLTAGEYSVTVTDDSSCTMTSTFIVSNIEQPTGEKVIITDVASDYNDGNVEENMLDEDLSTRWSSDLDTATAVFSLEQTYDVSSLRIAFYQGTVRQAYFSILVSVDSVNWDVVYVGESSGSSSDLELFTIETATANFIKIEGYGNSSSSSSKWNSITEFEAWGEVSDPQIPVDSDSSDSSDDSAPIITVSGKEVVHPGMVYSLDASESYDPEGENLEFTWIVPSNVEVDNRGKSEIKYIISDETDEELLSTSFVLKVSDGVNEESTLISVDIEEYKPEVSELTPSSISASTYDEDNYPEYILDKNTESYWSVSGESEWINLSFEEPVSFSHYKVKFTGEVTNMIQFNIYASNDNVNWELVSESVESNGFSELKQTFEVPETKSSTSYKYFKLVTSGDTSTVNISELEIYGTTEGTSAYDLVSIDDIVEVYPNPVFETLYINLEEESNVKIFDINGNIIYDQELDRGETAITEKLNTGNYVIQITTINSKKQYTNHIIVK